MPDDTKIIIDRINAILPPEINVGEDSPPEILWAAIFSLFHNHVEGPAPFATWKDAAVQTRIAPKKNPI